METGEKASIIFWDFDGVIKDSLEVKTNAFVTLFKPYGLEVVKLVRQHHEANGGMSRYDKIPIYLRFGGVEPTDDLVMDLCDQFSELVFQNVIDSAWVKGAEEYIRGNTFDQTFILVSATPHEELELIVSELNLITCFHRIFGAPKPKSEAIRQSLSELNELAERCIMVGDGLADLEAAQLMNVPFVLRKHSLNNTLFNNFKGKVINNISEL